MVTLSASRFAACALLLLGLGLGLLLSGCKDVKRGQPEEAEQIRRILASPVGETDVTVMRGADGERIVEIEITGGLTDSMAWDGRDTLDVDRRFDVVVRRLARDYAPFDSVTQVDIQAMKSAGVGAVYFEKGESTTYTRAELKRVADGTD